MPQTDAKCPVCGQSKVTLGQFDGRLILPVNCEFCGKFSISDEAIFHVEQTPFEEKRHLLSGVLRNAWENGQRLTILTTNIEELLNRAPTSLNIGSLLDKILLAVLEATLSSKSLRSVVTVKDTVYPLYYLRSIADLRYVVGLLQQTGFLDLSGGAPEGVLVKLTLAGWGRGEQLQLTSGRPDQAFVAMWFDATLRSVYEEGIRPALEATGYEAVRVDLVEHTGRIDDRILAEIRRSGLLIADFTGHRQGVYFEAGFALGLGVPVIWSCREDDIEKAHFDTRQYNHLTWNSATEIRERLEARVRALGLARANQEKYNAGLTRRREWRH